ncbi:MAG: type II toxin-antitoxin system VapC family toxin [Acidobacteriota bacterium]
MIVADSDILIDALRGRRPARERIDRELATGQLATTAISVFELLSGSRSSSQIEKVTRLLAPLVILPLDADAAHRAAEIRASLEAEGRGLAMADYLIAGICVSRNAVLLTRNRSHFERVPELRLDA